MDKQYKIVNVQPRDPWTGKFGTFNAFALQLEGVEGWVELSQKPETTEPAVGAELFGHLEVQTRGDKTYQKFKKQAPKDGGFTGGNPQIAKDLAYIIMMLEEITDRRDRVENPFPRDEAPTDEEGGRDFKLEEIPF